jgi:hypothetical protein
MATNASNMIHPSNGILVDSIGLHTQTLRIETNTSCYPGSLVIKGTKDDEVLCGTSGGAVIGWLGYEHTTKKHRPATMDTIYAQDAYAAVHYGSGIILMAWLANGQTVTKGTRLCAAAAGELTTATACAPPTSSTPMASTGAQATMAGPIPTLGIVVAIAEEYKAASGSTRILVRSLI